MRLASPGANDQLMVDTIYSSNSVAIRLLLDSGVDASIQGPNGDPFFLHAKSNLLFEGSANAEVIAKTLVDAGARIPESAEEEYVQLWFKNLGSTGITTTLLRIGQFLAGNRFAKGKAAKLSRAWAGRLEEVLRVLFLRTVVVIPGPCGLWCMWAWT